MSSSWSAISRSVSIGTTACARRLSAFPDRCFRGCAHHASASGSSSPPPWHPRLRRRASVSRAAFQVFRETSPGLSAVLPVAFAGVDAVTRNAAHACGRRRLSSRRTDPVVVEFASDATGRPLVARRCAARWPPDSTGSGLRRITSVPSSGSAAIPRGPAGRAIPEVCGRRGTNSGKKSATLTRLIPLL
jgi:hypothetical protein